MRRVRPILFVVLSVAACGSDEVEIGSAPTPHERRPDPAEIVGFEVRPVPATTSFQEFEIRRGDLEDVLSTWHEVGREHWHHGFSHVGGEDRTGTLELSDGSVVGWMMRPAGLATLTFPDGETMYLAKETPLCGRRHDWERH